MHIVCYDPRNIVRPGSVVEDATYPTYSTRGVALLPLNVQRYYEGPVNGFSLKLLGERGWLYDRNKNERGVVIPLALPPGDHDVHWYARLAPIDAERAVSGQFKLIVDTSGGQGMGALRPLERVDSLPKPDAYKGMNVYGRSSLSTSVGGMVSMMLYGIADNITCLAFGVSVP